MIILRRINGSEITVNADEIELIESSHDTTVSLKSGKKLIVMENPREITEKVIDYKRKCFTKLPDLDK
ncbi:MAG: flagellar FlbD family protein [Candidatus Kapaibacterium sp.]